jgi:DNA-binding SARP family transcriptional activator/tetratricopeptide (TPR) repeat protein
MLRRGDRAGLLEAAETAADADGRIPAGLAWRLARVQHQAGRLDEALRSIDRARMHDAEPADRAQVLAAQAATHWARGELDRARSAADEALSTAKASGDDGAVATALVAQALVCAAEGDRNGNRRFYDLALARAERGGDVLTELRILNNLGSLETEEGRCLSALAFLDRALARCDEEGPVPLAAALAHLNRAEALLGLGRAEEALAELDVARATYRELDAPLLGQVLVTIGDTNRIRGHAALATAAYREAVETVAATGSAQVLVPALSGLARTCVVDDPDEARRFLAAALAQPGALGTVAAVLAGGWLALVDGDEAEAETQARSAEREAGRRHDLPRLAEALELRALAQVRAAGAPSADVVDRLAEAAAIWAEIENPIGLAVNQVLTGRLTKDAGVEQPARQRLLTLGVRDDAARVAGPLMALEALAATGIRVRSLGTFAVLRDGHPVPTSAWQSRKTRDLLKLLVGRTGGLTRDALAEHLWPGQSGTGGRLSTVLSTLRSVLDPDRRHPSDRYLVADRVRVRLDRSTVIVDADEFRAAALAALTLARGPGVSGAAKAIAGLERAAAGYTGDYLEGDDAPWASETRIELRALADQVRRELARLLLDAGRPDAATSWLVSLVADDPYDEASHRTLVGALSRAGRHGEAQRRYAQYAARMAELGTEPAPLADLRT